ncbi:hypothetical protein BH09PLA1_BH09PLA1_11360 [soil metagenome]
MSDPTSTTPASDPTNWDALKPLLADALELPANEREQFIITSCKGELPLMMELRSLVAAYEQSDGVIDKRTDAWLGLGGPDLLSLNGQRIGRYTLDRLLAEGAMAAVYVATQVNPQRAVALKLVRFNLPLLDAAHRFKREADVLGRLQHPNIARIYEAGVHRAAGSVAMPYIAMEFVNGPPLNIYARDKQLSRADRIRLMIKVASAVHAAHQQAVIHRDLKPANVLVDETGEPKVLDFGIARIIGVDDQKLTMQTTAGVLLGTPGYMSPEQAAGKPDEVDVRSDVWALGVLLHELLTDRLPIELKDTSIAQALVRIATFEPEPIGKFDKTLRGDLETIVMTALNHEKEQRYSSAQALADDLRRVLDYEPISARAPTRWYRARKFIRRHRVGLSITALFALMLTAAPIVASIGFARAARDRDAARAINEFLKQMIASADPNTGAKDVTVLESLKSAEDRIGVTFGNAPLLEGELRATLAWMYQNLGEYDRATDQINRAISLHTAALGPSDPQTLADYAILATVLRWQYRPNEARDVAQKAYDRALATLGAQHSVTIGLREPLAGVAWDLGDLTTAEREYRALVPANQKLHGDTDEQTLTAMSNLAAILSEEGKYSEAEALMRRLVEIREKTLPPGSSATLTTRQNLAVAYSGHGNFAEAEKELRALAADAEKYLGPNHNTTLAINSNWSEQLQSLGRAEEALAVFKMVLERQLATYGPAHDLSVRRLADYAFMLNRAEQWEPALDYAQRALDAAIARHGPESVIVTDCQHAKAAALAGLKRYADAQALYRVVIDAFARQAGDDNPKTLMARSNLALCLVNQGRGPDAIAILEPVLHTVTEKNLGFMEARLRRTFGRALLLEKKYPEAERELLLAYQLSDAHHEARNMSQVSESLALLYDALNRPDDAKVWRDRVAITK